MEDRLTEKLYVDEEAEKLIHYTFKQYKLLAALWITFSMLSIIIPLVSVIKSYKYYPSSWREIFNSKIYPYLFMITIIISILQLYNYYQAISHQKRALTESNKLLFSKSFLFYKRGNFMAIAVVCIQLIDSFIFLY